MAKRIGLGIIGCGAISRFHINGYLALPEKAQILAVCDVIEERAKSRAEEILSEYTKQAQQAKDLAEKAAMVSEKEKLRKPASGVGELHKTASVGGVLTARQALYEEYSQNAVVQPLSPSGVKVFTDFHEMLKLPGLDAVSVCTPPFVHAKATIASAKAGKHVFCEKPMAMNATEARAMCEACNQAGVKLGYQSGGTRLGAVNFAIRNYIVSGKLGNVYYGRATSFRIRGRPGVDQRWFIDSSKAGGGAFYDIGVYDVDKVLYLLGDPQPSTISAITYRGIGGPGEESGCIPCGLNHRQAFVDVGDYIDDVEEHASVSSPTTKRLMVRPVHKRHVVHLREGMGNQHDRNL